MRVTMPTPEQVRQLPELVRVRVPKEWEDLNGHVNVKHHLTMYDMTSDPLLELLGISEEWVRTQRLGLFDLEHHIWFLNEVHVGEEVALFLSFTARNEKRVQGHVFLLNVTTSVWPASSSSSRPPPISMHGGPCRSPPSSPTASMN